MHRRLRQNARGLRLGRPLPSRSAARVPGHLQGQAPCRTEVPFVTRVHGRPSLQGPRPDHARQVRPRRHRRGDLVRRHRRFPRDLHAAERRRQAPSRVQGALHQAQVPVANRRGRRVPHLERLRRRAPVPSFDRSCGAQERAASPEMRRRQGAREGGRAVPRRGMRGHAPVHPRQVRGAERRRRGLHGRLRVPRRLPEERRRREGRLRRALRHPLKRGHDRAGT